MIYTHPYHPPINEIYRPKTLHWEDIPHHHLINNLYPFNAEFVTLQHVHEYFLYYARDYNNLVTRQKLTKLLRSTNFQETTIRRRHAGHSTLVYFRPSRPKSPETSYPQPLYGEPRSPFNVAVFLESQRDKDLSRYIRHVRQVIPEDRERSLPNEEDPITQQSEIHHFHPHEDTYVHLSVDNTTKRVYLRLHKKSQEHPTEWITTPIVSE